MEGGWRENGGRMEGGWKEDGGRIEEDRPADLEVWLLGLEKGEGRVVEGETKWRKCSGGWRVEGRMEG
jgi:hypothetical protein